MESASRGIYALFALVSEIERVSAANEWDFWYVNNSCVNPYARTFQEVFSIYKTRKVYST